MVAWNARAGSVVVARPELAHASRDCSEVTLSGLPSDLSKLDSPKNLELICGQQAPGYAYPNLG